MKNRKQRDEISIYIADQEYIANNYVMKCFAVTMLVFSVAYLLNVLGIFIIEQKLMRNAFVSSVVIYSIVYIVTRFVSLSNRKMKYFILFCIILMFTITGVFITYHVVLVLLLPILYAVLYSSKPVMRYVYFLTILSTIVTVYCGYYYGLCDANMVLLTSDSMQSYVSGGQFVLTQINHSPVLSLMLFFIIPRCLIYLAFMVVCSSLFHIVSGSLEKARLTEELEEAKEAAEKANRAKSQFLARMSHEIRTPVNAVMGMNEMIIRESREEQIRNYAYDVKNSSVELLSIINEILDSAKIESGKMEIVCADYEIGSLLNDLYNMISVKSREKGLQLIFDIDAGIPSKYYGDDKRIKQVLLNLLTNAVKYTNQGMVVLKLRCRVEGENAVLHYSVKDTGIGIRKEDMDKIFDTFLRVDVERNRNVEGTGLGMNIVQQLLKLMGSELKVQSEYEKGSEFSFELVQKIVNGKELGDFRERLLEASGQNQYRTGYIAPEAKILVVDDSQMNLKVFHNLLKESQIQVTEADSGKRCLELLREQKFDLIFLDHMMPEMDGIETFHAMCDNNLCSNTPVIMLTANAILGDRERYLREGFHDFLSKPIIPEKLDKIILKFLPEQFIRTGEVVATKRQEMSVEEIPEIDFEAGMVTCSGDRDFYLEILQDFTQLPVKEELTEFFNKQDYKNYCIRIHGFKNNAYSIGAKALGDLAYEMEKLTREKIPEEIVILQQRLFSQYDSICRQYREIMEKNIDR
ncbi:MAG: response regulator [Acetatifactor sp.]